MFHISVSLTLLALVAGTFLLYKSKKEAFGNFAKWVAYFVIVFSLVMLVMDVTHGVMRMMHCGGEMDEHAMMHDGRPGMDGDMDCCRGGSGHDCCRMEGGMGHDGCSMHDGKPCHMEGDKCVEDKEHGKGECSGEEHEHEGTMHADSTAKK